MCMAGSRDLNLQLLDLPVCAARDQVGVAPNTMERSAFVAGCSSARLRQRASPWIASGVCVRRKAADGRLAQKPQSVQMGLFGLGLPEIAVIAGIGIFIFGPKKIAELGKDLGGVAGSVKKATSEFREAMQESLEEADKELEQKKLEKEEAKNQIVDASSKAIETTSAETTSEAN